MDDLAGEKDLAFIDPKTLENFMRDVMIGVGVPPDHAKTIADVLIQSDLRGIDSHGVGRLMMYYGRIKRKQQEPVTNLTIEKETPGTARINAHNGMGHVAAKFAMDLAIKKAKKVGIAMTVVSNSNHFGIAGYYPLMAVKQGMIGMCGTNTRPAVAPTWGVEPKLGTNPFTIAVPTDWEFPWCADQATSVIQRGKVEIYDRLQKAIPPGWVINEEGKPATNATQILQDLNKFKNSLTPLGGIGEEMAGYKGYNYSTFVEIMSACLCQANFLSATLGMKDGKFVPYNLGHFFIAVNVEAFIDLEEFKHTTGNMLRELAAAKKVPGAEHIYIAGEKEYNAQKERLVKGIPLSTVTQKEMLVMQKECGLSQYHFDFKVKADGLKSSGW